MQVKLSNGHYVNTKDLSDKDAEIYEAMQKFYKVLEKHRVTSFLRVILNDRDYVGFTTVPHSQEKLNSDYDFLMMEIGRFVEESSGGNMIVAARVKNGPEFPTPSEQ